MRLLTLLAAVFLFAIIAAESISSSSDKDDKYTKSLKRFLANMFQPPPKDLPKGEPATSASNTTNDSSQSWIDEVGENFNTFLKDKIFVKEKIKNKENEPTFLSSLSGETSSKNKDEESPLSLRTLFDRLASYEGGMFGSESLRRDFVVTELLQRTTMSEHSHSYEEVSDIASVMKDAFATAIVQLKNAFGETFRDFDPGATLFSMIYFVADQEAKRTPSWKRQQHRFYEEVTKSVVIELHDALYLSQLAYVDTVQEFRSYLQKFQQGVWELAYGTTNSLPSMPSHFLLIHKNIPWSEGYERTVLPWMDTKNELQITLVVRGTKHLSDVIADTLLELTDYRSGKAHSGILASGKALVERYTPKLKELLKHSGRDHIRLYIVGHSLGAGAGAIAAIEFKELAFITVEAVGFGCPALLSPELSESNKSFITTVVTDSDIIPRMSGSSMVNTVLDLFDFDWTKFAMNDLNFTLDRVAEATPIPGHLLSHKESVMQWAEDYLNRTFTKPQERQTQERLEVSLIPPGNCIHFFRDGVSFSSAYTPCKYFTSIEFSRTMIEDHLVIEGYHRSFLTFVRDRMRDYDFNFAHDIASIPT